jgi:hypothetical protein
MSDERPSGLAANNPKVSQERLLNDKWKFSREAKDHTNFLNRKKRATTKARAKAKDNNVVVDSGNKLEKNKKKKSEVADGNKVTKS